MIEFQSGLLSIALACCVRITKINIDNLAAGRQQRGLVKTHEPLVCPRSRDRVAISDHITRLEQINRGGEEHRGDLTRLSVAEVALDVG